MISNDKIKFVKHWDCKLEVTVPVLIDSKFWNAMEKFADAWELEWIVLEECD